MYSVKNTQPGPRGVNSVNGVVLIEVGQTVEVEMTDAEFASAKSTGHFEFDGEVSDELSDMSVAELTELAESSGVMPDEGSGKDGKVLKADIIAAIEAA